MKKLFALGLVLLASDLCPPTSSAQVPQLINYQGRLLSGTNLVNGNVGLSLRLFNLPSGGSSIYEDSNSVTVADGLYSTFIGDQAATQVVSLVFTNIGSSGQQAFGATGEITNSIDDDCDAMIDEPGDPYRFTHSFGQTFFVSNNPAILDRARLGVGILLSTFGACAVDGGGFALYRMYVASWDDGLQHPTGTPLFVSGKMTNFAAYTGSIAFSNFVAECSSMNVALQPGKYVVFLSMLEGGNGMHAFSTYRTSGPSGPYSGGEFVHKVDGTLNVATGSFTEAWIVTADRDANFELQFLATANLSSILQSSNIYIETAVNGVTLTPRERVASVAYSLVADSVRSGGITSTMLADGAVTGVKVADATLSDTKLMTITNAGKIMDSALSANVSLLGQSIASSEIEDGTIAAADLAGVLLSNTFWKTAGNAGTTAGTHFLGTTDNTQMEVRVNNLRVALFLPSNGAPNVVLGAAQNVISNGTRGASILGGSNNFIAAKSDYSFIGGGNFNSVATNSPGAFIGGGYANYIEGTSGNSVLGGGYFNIIHTNAGISFIGGGYYNRIEPFAFYSFIGGGEANTIGGGSALAAILGGFQNGMGTNAGASFIGAGNNNGIANNSTNAVIAGGSGNLIYDGSPQSFIGGGNQNTIASGSPLAFIGGGNVNTIQGGSQLAYIGGGAGNSIGESALYAAIDGGNFNQANSAGGAIGGGTYNAIGTNSTMAVVAGGYGNGIANNSHYAAIGGGIGNSISTDAPSATIPGGYQNSIAAHATNAFAAGQRARANHKGSFVWSDVSLTNEFASTAANQFLIRASGGVGIGTPAPEAELHVFRASAGTITAGASTLLAIENDSDALISMLAPTNATTGFVFDSPPGSIDAAIYYNSSSRRGLQFATDGNNTRMVITSNGLVGVGTTVPDAKLHVLKASAGTVTANTNSVAVLENSSDAYLSILAPTNGSTAVIFGSPLNANDGGIYYNTSDTRDLRLRTAGNITRMTITSNGYVGISDTTPSNLLVVGNNGAYCNGSSWVNVSDAGRKENFAPVDAADILNRVAVLPVSFWNYKTDEPSRRHIGPTAQDFHAAFHVGDNNTAISTIDPAGVALAAIQALKKELDAMKAENAGLRARLDALEKK